jgi:hypothetical protein
MIKGLSTRLSPAGWLAFLLAGLLTVLLVSTGCKGPAGPQGAAGINAAETCTQCHNNDTSLILAKSLQLGLSETGHSNFEVAATEGIRPTCGGCHSNEGFLKRMAAKIAPDKVTEVEANPTPPGCFTCHKIHSTYTKADFALTYTSPVTFYITGKTFDKGKGNLCVNCHQARTAPPAVGVGTVKVTSIRWGPHYGAQSEVLLGTLGYGPAGSTNPHYAAVTDSCVQCHMRGKNHEMKPVITTCTPCHKDATSFDINKLQTTVKAQHTELENLLLAKKMIAKAADGSITVVAGDYTEKAAGALWNYRVIYQDSSSGVHNPKYVKALLESALAALK